MQQIFEHIISSFQALWKIKNYGETIEVITPQAMLNDNFVSVFITRRGNEYVVTDGGWIEAGMYDTIPDHRNVTYQRLFKFYVKEAGVSVTEGKGRIFYFKKIEEERFIPNLVFEMSRFVASVVNANYIPLAPDKDVNTFKRSARTYLSSQFGDDMIEYDRPLNTEIGIKFSAIKRDSDGGTKLINFVSGSSHTNYANSLCRSNTNFQMIESRHEELGVKRTVTLLDDRKAGILDAPLIKPYIDYLRDSGKKANVVVLWSQHEQLKDIVNR